MKYHKVAAWDWWVFMLISVVDWFASSPFYRAWNSTQIAWSKSGWDFQDIIIKLQHWYFGHQCTIWQFVYECVLFVIQETKKIHPNDFAWNRLFQRDDRNLICTVALSGFERARSAWWLHKVESLRGWFFCAPAGRTRSALPKDWAPSDEHQQSEPVSVKERLAIYQAAVTKKETSGSSSAAVRRYFHTDVTGDSSEDGSAAGDAAARDRLNC